MTIVGVLLASLVGIGGSVAGASVVNQTAPPMTPTKALCNGKSWKIGYDVFSATQPFANLVTKGLKDAAKSIGCATVLTTVDNLNGPVAIGNVKTLLNEGANAIVDFNVLAPFQPAIAKLLKNAHVPGVAVVGADLPGYPSVGANNYGAAVKDGRALAKAGRRKFGSTVPYVVVAAEPSSGPIIMQRYYGAVAGAKTVYRNLPKSHIIEVVSDGTEAGTYNNAVSAFSQIPSGGVVLTTAVNDEVSHAMYKAALARKLTFLVNSFGGDPFGLGQVCKDRTHYAGALFLEPELWGSSALAVVLREANKMSYPKGIGIKGIEVTASNPIAGCK
jgi:ABC-type sugar transport system substrate-binding protein